MRTQLFWAALLISWAPWAQAFTFQQNCSSADGMIRLANGSYSNEARLMTYVERVSLQTELRYSLEDVEFEIGSSKNVLDVVDSKCQPGGASAPSIHRRTYTAQLILRRRDGTAFPVRTFGRHQGGLEVRGLVLCEEVVTGEMACAERLAQLGDAG